MCAGIYLDVITNIQSIMIYTKNPKHFSPTIEVVGCFMEKHGEILLLCRNKSKPQGGKWGIPAGKIDYGESKEEAMKREIIEETGYVGSFEKLTYKDHIFARIDNVDLVFSIFHLPIPEPFLIKIHKHEHTTYSWIKPEEAFRLDLMEDLDICIKQMYDM